MKRMIDFADKNNLEIVLAYYPPYFNKYNPIERCWGILENHWHYPEPVGLLPAPGAKSETT
jgi:transposase